MFRCQDCAVACFLAKVRAAQKVKIADKMCLAFLSAHLRKGMGTVCGLVDTALSRPLVVQNVACTRQHPQINLERNINVFD